MYIYIYIYMYTHVYMLIDIHIYIYIYIYMDRVGVIGWANNHFNNLRFKKEIEKKNDT